MLNMHPAIHVPVELGGLYSSLPRRLRYFGDLNDPFHRTLLANEMAHTGHLAQFEGRFDRDTFEYYLTQSDYSARSVIESFYSTLLDDVNKSRIGDKTPDHMPYFSEIVRLFPDAQIVHLVRDGRDCALSSMSWRRGINFRNIWELGRSWSRDNIAVANWGERNPESYLLVRYEDLVDHTEYTLQKIVAHLGEEYSVDMLEFHRGDFVQQNASRLEHHSNLTRDIMRGNHGKWAHSMPVDHLKIYEHLACDALKDFGYPIQYGTPLTLREQLLTVRGNVATQSRRLARKLRTARNQARFRVALSIKRRARIERLHDATPRHLIKR